VQQVTINGTPDILLCCNGWFVALELKSDAKQVPSPLQEWNLSSIRAARGKAYSVHPGNYEWVMGELDKLIKKEGDSPC